MSRYPQSVVEFKRNKLLTSTSREDHKSRVLKEESDTDGDRIITLCSLGELT